MSTRTQRTKTLPRNEQETIIGRMADEDHWVVYTCDRVMKRRLERLAQQQGLEIRGVDEDGIEVEVPVAWVKIRPQRQLSDAERERCRLQARARWSGVQNLPLRHVSDAKRERCRLQAQARRSGVQNVPLRHVSGA